MCTYIVWIFHCLFPCKVFLLIFNHVTCFTNIYIYYSDSVESDNDCNCPLINDPVCCYDSNNEKIAYDNLCLAKCADSTNSIIGDDANCKPGTCGLCGCQPLEESVCCYHEQLDGFEKFSNLCNAKCADPLYDEATCVLLDDNDNYNGECDGCEGECVLDWDPIYCNDKMYWNSCFAKCDGIDYDKSCTDGMFYYI